MHRVCYVTNWSRYRPGEAKFEIEFIDPFMCSHIIYAYAIVDDGKPEIVPVQKDDLGMKEKKLHERCISSLLVFLFVEHYRELGLLKKSNPNLKISIRLGGKIAQYTRYLKQPNMATQLVRSLIWYILSFQSDHESHPFH